MPHILAIIPPFQTLSASYSGKAYKNRAGHTECVEFIQQAMGAPATPLWREGRKVTKGDQSIVAGTAIATFVNGRYPQHGSTGKHAAVYLGQDESGIQVLDQWGSQGRVLPRTIYWIPRQPHPSLSNDATAFSIIEW